MLHAYHWIFTIDSVGKIYGTITMERSTNCIISVLRWNSFRCFLSKKALPRLELPWFYEQNFCWGSIRKWNYWWWNSIDFLISLNRILWNESVVTFFFYILWQIGLNVLTGIIAKEFVETSKYPKVIDEKFYRLLAAWEVEGRGA